MPAEFKRHFNELRGKGHAPEAALATATRAFVRRHRQKQDLALQAQADASQQKETERKQALEDQIALERAKAKARPKPTTHGIGLNFPTEDDTVPAEWKTCVTALLAQGKPAEEAYAICTQQFIDTHGKTPQEAAKETAEHSGAADERLNRFQNQTWADFDTHARGRMQNFIASYYQAAIDPNTITINTIDRKSQEVEGYASYYRRPMRSGVVMSPGSFTKEDLDLFMTNPVLLRNHNYDKPVGNIVKLWDDGEGLKCRARVDHPETWDDILHGRIRAFSWGGQIVKNHYEALVTNGEASESENAAREIDDRMHVDEAALLEISVVTVPNSPQSLFAIAKSFTPGAKNDFSIWAPLKNIDAEERMVYGYATVFGEPDADGHVMTRQAVEQALVDYRQWANVREMHAARAVGTAPILEVNDTGLWVGVYISKGEENCWEKIRDRTYQGFSIGGAALEWTPGVQDGHPVLFLNKIRIDEISVCDRPKVAKATFSIIKRFNEETETFSLTATEQGIVTPLGILAWEDFPMAQNSKSTPKERRSMNPDDFGDPENKKFPIIDASDVADAAALIGKAHNPDAVKARIVAIAKRKGFPIPEAWQHAVLLTSLGGTALENTSEPSAELTQEQKLTWFKTLWNTITGKDEGLDSMNGSLATSVPGVAPPVPDPKEPAGIENAMKMDGATLANVHGHIAALHTKMDHVIQSLNDNDADDRGAKNQADPQTLAPAPAPTGAIPALYQIDSAFVASFEKYLQTGKTRLEAYNSALEELAGEDANLALDLIGLGEHAEKPANVAAEPKTDSLSDLLPKLITSAVAQAVAPIDERIAKIEQNNARPLPQRRSQPITPVVSQNRAGDRDGKDVWDGLWMPGGGGPSASRPV